MYKVKPINEKIFIDKLPTVMYPVKSYYSDDLQQSHNNNNDEHQNEQQQQQPNGQQSSSSNNQTGEAVDLLVELNKQQQAQLRRLKRLKEKLNQFCDDLNLNHLIIETNESVTSTSNNNNNNNNNKENASSSTSSSSSSKQSVSASNTNNSNNNNNQQRIDFSLNSIVQEQLKLNVGPKSKTIKNKSIVDDLVIQVDPQHVPYSLFVLFDQLRLDYKCFIQFFIHGSVLNKLSSLTNSNNNLETRIRNLIDLFKSLKLNANESRNNYDYSVTFIWNQSKVEKLGPALSLNKSVKIYGESNILRYFSRLLTSELNYGKLNANESIQIDEWIDKCTNELRLANKPNYDAYLTDLNRSLEKSNYLYGAAISAKPTIADWYNWSVLKQSPHRINEKKFVNVANWLKRLESNPLVQLLNLV